MKWPMCRLPELTARQVQCLLAVTDTEWKGMVLLGLDTGGRLEDVAKLRWRNVNMERREVCYVLRKMNHMLVVPMTADLYGYLASVTRAADPEAPLFPNCFKYAQAGYGKLAARFRQLQVKAGLEPVGFHSLRVTFIVALKRLGVPEDLIVQLVGCSPWWIKPARPETKAEEVAMLPMWLV
jgi:integrase